MQTNPATVKTYAKMLTRTDVQALREWYQSDSIKYEGLPNAVLIAIRCIAGVPAAAGVDDTEQLARFVPIEDSQEIARQVLDWHKVPNAPVTRTPATSLDDLLGTPAPTPAPQNVAPNVQSHAPSASVPSAPVPPNLTAIATALTQLIASMGSQVDPAEIERIATAAATRAGEGAAMSIIAAEIDRMAAKAGGLAATALRPAILDVAATAAREAVLAIAPRQVEVKTIAGNVVNVGVQHRMFDTVLKHLRRGFHVWLGGPAGSGKSSVAESLAKALEVPFHFSNRLMQAYEIFGYVDANGKYHETPFYRAWKNGGLWLNDEVDRGAAEATVALNFALAGRVCVFPNGEVLPCHKDFYCIAAGNTMGFGGDSVYVAAVQLDGAFLNRFVKLPFEYDEQLECHICGNAQWAATVQRYRKAAAKLELDVLITPRESIRGAICLADGDSMEETIETIIRAGMPNDQWQALQAAFNTINA